MIPLTVVGGYLGAGKTTLINRLLAADHSRRLAVLVNDFGDVNIDAGLIAANDGGTISLTNGCVCCTIADALGDALDKVLALPTPPDQIVVEASGVADPAKIAIYGQGWPGLRLDAVLCLADVETVRDRARDKFVGRHVLQQLRSSDFVLLTKVDLADAATIGVARDWVAAEAPDAQILEDAPIDLLLDLKARPASRSSETGARAHNLDFVSLTFETDRLFDRAALHRLMDNWPKGPWRAKGLVAFADAPNAFETLHRVGRRWSLAPGPGAPKGGSTVVMIGPALGFDRVAVRRDLAGALSE